MRSLKGCPQRVNGYFNCANNNIATLEYLPQHVGNIFYAKKNPLLGDIQIAITFRVFYEKQQEVLIEKEKEHLEQELKNLAKQNKSKVCTLPPTKPVSKI